ncbi:hypothetical protein L195_g010817 [Trifolium pratense]|uniref:Uncharacterized protein n=1 Tax=Trifolium pratense TaxID=57577 RepID=A0A2K3PFR6_TRIPR|nr:hypothetical protein L195_g010817 [Trifolium pratense]
MFIDFMNDGTEEELLRLNIEQAQEEAAAASCSRRRRRRRKIERNNDAGHDSNSTKQDDAELDPKSRDSDEREEIKKTQRKKMNLCLDQEKIMTGSKITDLDTILTEEKKRGQDSQEDNDNI